MSSRPRPRRGLPAAQAGTSVIAALVFAALLGAVALGLHAFQPGSANNVALPAQASAPAASVDQSCQEGMDYNLAVVPSYSLVPAYGTPSYENGSSQLSDQAIRICTSGNQVYAAAKSAYQYTSTDGTVKGTLPQTISSDQTNLPSALAKTVQPQANRTQCTNPDSQPTATKKVVCKYVLSGSTYQVQSAVQSGPWTCHVNFYFAGGTPACWDKDVPLGNGVNDTAPANLPPSNSGSDNGANGNPIITPNNGLCGNGATNPPTCDACPGGVQGYTDDGQTICANTSTQPTPETPNTNSCGNGATNPPTCDACPNGIIAGYTDTGQTICQGLSSSPGTQGGTCTNGANNPPACNICPSGSSGGYTDDGLSFYCRSSTANQLCPGGDCSPPGKQQQQPPANNQNNTGNPLSSFLRGLKQSTFGNPQYQGGNPNNTCTVLSSLFGCNNSLSCQLSISPNPPQPGMPANLTWTSSGNVYQAQISGVGNVGPSGSYTVYPNGAANYTMIVYGQNNSGTASCNTTLNGTSLAGCTGTNSCTSSQTPYGVGTNGQACSQPPPQPAASSCTTGSWQPVSAASNGCITSYQCGGQTAGTPTAQLSCSPQTADVGMTVAMSYSCGNATGSSGAGFSTGNQTSGSTTTVITTPPSGTNTANFGLTCTNGSQATGAQCSVQINQPAIVLVSNPKTVPNGQPSSIGWVTAGMQACVISSPQDAAFTASNANNQSVNGVAQTDGITGPTEFDLTCTTLGGQTRIASTTVSVGTASSTAAAQ